MRNDEEEHSILEHVKDMVLVEAESGVGIAKRVYKFLCRDQADIIADGSDWWFEPLELDTAVPSYAAQYISKLLKFECGLTRKVKPIWLK